MVEYYSVLKRSLLFQGITEEELKVAAPYLSPVLASFQKGEFISRVGDELTQIGIVLEGSVHIIKEDSIGGRLIVAEMSKSDIFSESIACARIKSSPVGIFAAEASKILFFDPYKIFFLASISGAPYEFLIENLVKTLAIKNLRLNKKIDILSKKSVRQRLLVYFSHQVQLQQKNTIVIPFTREELADYISANRSATSRELSKMRSEGLLTFRKNKFTILKLPTE